MRWVLFVAVALLIATVIATALWVLMSGGPKHNERDGHVRK